MEGGECKNGGQLLLENGISRLKTSEAAQFQRMTRPSNITS